MAIYSKQVTVSTTATELTTDTNTGQGRCWKIAVRGSNAIYIGDSTVTSTSGFQLRTLGDGSGTTDPVILEVEVRPDETLWAITSTGSSTVHVFTT